MNILFTGRKAHLTATLKSFVETKLSKLSRVLDDILDVHVILKREKHRHVAEIIVRSRFATLAATAVGPEFRESAGHCIDRLLAQAKKHSGRLKARRRGRGAWTASRHHVQQPAGVEETSDEVSINVVRMGRVPVRAISLREALDEAQGDGNPIVVFRNAESKGVAVIFLRPDGQFGLVEMEA